MNNYYGNAWDQDLRQQENFISSGLANTYMKQVFAIMAVGLGITGITAYFFGNQLLNGEMLWLFMGSTRWLVIFAPVALALVLSFAINKMSYTMASLVFGVYALLNGLSFSVIFLIYTQASIFKTFFVAAAMFGTMAFVGATTKTDLTKMGSYLIMGLIGIFIAGIVNIFLKSSMMDFIVSGLGVLIFTGLTAYDVQKLIAVGANADTENEGVKKTAILGALTLYLDFINLFMYLLRFLGNRRD